MGMVISYCIAPEKQIPTRKRRKRERERERERERDRKKDTEEERNSERKREIEILTRESLWKAEWLTPLPASHVAWV
jgi:hypothetical protein